MNNRGQVIMVGMMIAVVLTILAISLAFPLQETIDGAMTDMNCSDGVVGVANFSIDTQATCIATDFSLPIFIGTILAVAGVAMLGRIYS